MNKMTPEKLVEREVVGSLSHLVATLAQGAHAIENAARLCDRGDEAAAELADLCEQAMELCRPIDDWEEAAIQAGYQIEQSAEYLDCFIWRAPDGDSEGFFEKKEDAWRAACGDGHVIEPYQREIFEHWAVSDWLASELEERGERVERDFAGMTVWGRTCSGQGIDQDGVIQEICAAINARVSAAD